MKRAAAFWRGRESVSRRFAIIGRCISGGFLFFLIWNCTPGHKQADLLVYNARVYTVDSTFSTASAFVVSEGKILAVGQEQGLRDRYKAMEELDAGGRAVVPGLIDAHCHFYDLGLKQQQVNLTGTQSFEEVLSRVAAFQEIRQADFIFGKGWDQNDWEQTDFPDNSELNRLYPDIPVVLERIDGHAYLVNQKGLDLAGIDESTPAVGGAIIKREGKPTGVLVDGPMEGVNAILPAPSRELRVQALREAERICLGYGLTTVNDAGLSPEVIHLMDSLQRAGDLDIRIYAMVSATPANLTYFLDKGPLKTDRLHVRSFKVYADGALGSRGAVLKEAYSDWPGHFGALVTPVTEIQALAERISSSPFQMNTHAIGDSANALVLKTYQSVLAGQRDRRWKVEHAQVVTPDEFDLFGPDIIPSVQPTHATSDMYWAESRLGTERMGGAYAYQSLLQASGLIALGTDFPVEEVSPFLTFYAAVARKDVQGYPEEGFGGMEALSKEEALRGMTIWAAYSNFESEEKGSIEIGKWADFVILSGDLMEVPLDEIPKIKAEAVYIAGKRVYPE